MNGNYILILDWMQDDLGLKGHELLCYAIIYGFSQDDESMMTGGIEYLKKRMQSGRTTVIRVLQSLVDKGLICRKEVITDSCKRVFYYVNSGYQNETKVGTKMVLRGYQNGTKGGTKMVPSNKDKEINKEINKKEHTNVCEKKLSVEEKKFLDGMVENYPNISGMDKPLTYEQYNKVRNQYDLPVVTKVMQAMENKKDLRKKYVSAYLTLLNWLRMEKERSK